LTQHLTRLTRYPTPPTPQAGDVSDDDDDEKPKTGQGTAAGTASGVSKEDVYKAYSKVRLDLNGPF